MNRSTFSGILTAVFLSVLCIPCAAGVSAEAKTGFSDVDKENPFYEEIRLCCEAGLMEPLEAGRFGPEEPLNKGDLVRLVARLYSLSIGGDGGIPAIPEDLDGYVRFLDPEGNLVHDLSSAYCPDFYAEDTRSMKVIFWNEDLSQERLDLQVGFTGGEGFLCASSGELSECKGFLCAASGRLLERGEDRTSYLFRFPDGVDAQEVTALLTNYSQDRIAWRSAWKTAQQEGYEDPTPYDAVLFLRYWMKARLPFCFRTMSLDSMPDISVWRMELAIPLAELCKDLPEVRTVDSIPDLPDNYRFQNSETEAVLSLYRRGILNGFDGAGTFGGAEWLTRGQAAAMAARALEAGLGS